MQSFSGLHRYIMERGCKFVMEREKSMKKTIGSTLLLLLLFSNEMTLFFVCNSKKAFASACIPTSLSMLWPNSLISSGI